MPGASPGTSTSSACTTDAQKNRNGGAPQGRTLSVWTRPALLSARACSPRSSWPLAAWLLLKAVIGVVAGLAWLVAVGVLLIAVVWAVRTLF